MSTLCLNMIVKNEEKNLPACLNSVKDIVDEVVVVDTGSTDSTIKIAEEFGAHVYRYPWTNDFSDARNFALSKARANWILYLDADEQLDKNSISTLKKIINNKKNLGVRCKIFSEDNVNKKPKLQSYTRLFRNAPQIKFTGKVHEQIDESLLRENYQIIDSDILINHSGYNLERDALVTKAQRNLKLLQSEYAEHPTGYTAFQLGNTYSILKDSNKAVEYYQKATGDRTLPVEYRSLSLSYCAEYYMSNNESAAAFDMIIEAVKLDPDNIVTNLAASEIYFQRNEPEQAVHHCMKALEENENRSGKKNGSRLIDVFHEDEKIIYHGLNVSFSTNHKEGIEYFFNKLQSFKEKNQLLWQNELAMIQSLSAGETLSPSQLDTAVGLINDYNLEFYSSLLKGSQNLQLQLPLMQRIIAKFPDSRKQKNQYGLYLKDANKVDEAAEIFRQSVEEDDTNTSAVFYLISIFLEQQNYSELEKLINRSKEKFAHNKGFIQQLNNLELKISSLQLNTN